MAGKYIDASVLEIVEDVDKGRIILPAMQRNFVWDEHKICDLFDSLMRDYPIGTFLFWGLEKETFKKYIFNCFLKDYSERKSAIPRGERATKTYDDYSAVLDGQQRITSLYIGLKGSYETHLKGKPWNDPNSFEQNYLCIDLLHMPSDINDSYNIQFKDKISYTEIYGRKLSNNDSLWFRVSDIFDEKYVSPTTKEFSINTFSKVVQKERDVDLDTDQLDCLQQIGENMHHRLTEKDALTYYKSKDSDLSKVIKIFVRVNSGGQKLSASDLMLSIAAAQFTDVDLQMELNDSVDRVKAATVKSFPADKEFVLTAGLLCTDAESVSLQKPQNWDIEVLKPIIKSLNRITDAICGALKFIEGIGFELDKLLSKNMVLPIVYHFYKKNLKDTYIDSSKKEAVIDRVYIRQWFIRSMVNGVFSDSIPSTLVLLRQKIVKAEQDGIKYFPFDSLFNDPVKKGLDISDDQIDSILSYKYGESQTKAMLCELTKTDSTMKIDVDHIWPKSKLLKKSEFKKFYKKETGNEPTEDDYRLYNKQCNLLVNLQPLKHATNQGKSEKLFDEWLEGEYPDQDKRLKYFEENMIPVDGDLTYSFSEFPKFCEKRTKIIRDKIEESFPNSIDQIIKRNSLTF